MAKNIAINSSLDFDSSKSINLSKDLEKETLNLNNYTLEEILNITDLIEKMSNYKNKTIFSQ